MSPSQTLVLLRQELHREMDALQLAAGNFQVARMLRAAASRIASNSLRRSSTGTFTPDMRVGLELHAFGRHLLEAAVDEVLLHLEIRDAVAQQSADAVGLLEHGDVVAGAGQLLRGRQSRRTGADDRDALAGARRRAAPAGSSLLRNARSTIVFSISLIVTGGSLMPSTQAASHGAGQMRPVNSGKLLVECRTRMASFQRPR